MGLRPARRGEAGPVQLGAHRWYDGWPAVRAGSKANDLSAGIFLGGGRSVLRRDNYKTKAAPGCWAATGGRRKATRWSAEFFLDAQRKVGYWSLDETPISATDNPSTRRLTTNKRWR